MLMNFHYLRRWKSTAAPPATNLSPVPGISPSYFPPFYLVFNYFSIYHVKSCNAHVFLNSPLQACNLLFASSQLLDFSIRVEVNCWQADGQRPSGDHLMSDTCAQHQEK